MARAAVVWGVRELAEKASINPNTVSRIENGGDALASTLDRIQASKTPVSSSSTGARMAAQAFD
jgi:transcriptional regulator with XRE-family HTH domain